MNKKGEITILAALIVGGAVLIAGLFVAYKPHCSFQCWTANKLDLNTTYIASNFKDLQMKGEN